MESRKRLADEIPFCRALPYHAIQRVAPELTVNLLNRFPNLNEIAVNEPVEDVQRFLNFLKNFDNVVVLLFVCDQPQDLFDRLPEHSAVQRLAIHGAPADLRFLFRLKELIIIQLGCSIGLEFIRKVLEELPFLSRFYFRFLNEEATIQTGDSKRFEVSFGRWRKVVADLNTAIQFIVENLKEGDNKRELRRR